MSNPIATPFAAPAEDFNAPLSRSYPAAAAALAQQSIERDLEEVEEQEQDGHNPTEPRDLPPSRLRPSKSHDASAGYSMSGSYRRPSFITLGQNRSAMLTGSRAPHTDYLTDEDLAAVRADERSLLRDNAVIPPKHPRRTSHDSGIIASQKGNGQTGSFRRALSRTREDEEVTAASTPQHASEATPLLAGAVDPSLPYGGQDGPENIDQKWEEAVMAGKIQTDWKRETKVLARYSRSLVLTFLLQYSIPVTSVFTVGHLGKLELGAVSLGSVTANITGFAVYQGLATSLDTLCAQAYGSGQKKLVGLQLQRVLYFLWACTIPIGAIWLCGERILNLVVPDPEVARMAGIYLKVILVGAPFYAAFECGKRFIQAQGLFSVTLFILLIVAPLNMFLHWLFVWKLHWGFVGAPIAVTITEILMPILLLLYVYFFNGKECWGGFSKAAFRNWWPMIKLAIPGLVMVLAEFLAFEILTLSSSRISSEHLAAQSVLSTILAITFMIPFPMSIAASTRIANLIGATLAPAAKVSARVALVAAVFVGLANMILLSSLKDFIPRLFTNDAGVSDLVTQTLPLCAAFSTLR